MSYFPQPAPRHPRWRGQLVHPSTSFLHSNTSLTTDMKVLHGPQRMILGSLAISPNLMAGFVFKKYAADIHSHQRINHFNVGHCMNFPLAAPSGQNVNFTHRYNNNPQITMEVDEDIYAAFSSTSTIRIIFIFSVPPLFCYIFVQHFRPAGCDEPCNIQWLLTGLLFCLFYVQSGDIIHNSYSMAWHSICWLFCVIWKITFTDLNIASGHISMII